MIEVEYDGKYPNACSGKLTIKRNGNIIYEKSGCCHSTGSVWFDKDWGEHIEEGDLVWNEDEAKKFDNEVQDEVANELLSVSVCCGGCV